MLTRLRGRFWLPRPPVPEARPEPPPDPGTSDIDRILAEFVASGPPGRRDAVDRYLDWLRGQGIAPDARAIGEEAPRDKAVVVYELARRVSFEIARRDPDRKYPHLEAWQKRADESRAFYEKRLAEELFGRGWLKRAIRQGPAIGATTGFLTALFVAAALALVGAR